MKAVCERHGALFILDEVFAGMGRTGTLHAYEQEDVVPDLQTVAKGLGAGYQAIGALLVSKKVVGVLGQGSKAFVHFQTYHGHPVACAAAYAVQQVIKDEGLVENARVLGQYLGEQLQDRLGSHKHIGNIRGRGLVWGVCSPTTKVVGTCSTDAIPLRSRLSRTKQQRHRSQSAPRSHRRYTLQGCDETMGSP